MTQKLSTYVPGMAPPLLVILYQVRLSLPKTLSPRHPILKKRPSLMDKVEPG